ncbi:MAG: hypothetical protein ABIQ00_00400 [Chitinophagaceae bacterium]
MAISKSEFVEMPCPELTRIKDTDGDGQADLDETVTDDFGVAGNYHEFNYGPVRNKDGNLFIVLNLASAGGGIRPEVRGKLDTIHRSSGRDIFSVVPFRGWIMKQTPGGKLVPYAMGFGYPTALDLMYKGIY